MDDQPLRTVNFHFRFKFLAITTITFLLYVILSSSSEFDQFASSMQFKLMGPYFIISGILYFIFRKFPIKCPYCHKILVTKKDWHCPECNQAQGKERFLMDKCIHCKQILATCHCDHCKQEFRL